MSGAPVGCVVGCEFIKNRESFIAPARGGGGTVCRRVFVGVGPKKSAVRWVGDKQVCAGAAKKMPALGNGDGDGAKAEYTPSGIDWGLGDRCTDGRGFSNPKRGCPRITIKRWRKKQRRLRWKRRMEERVVGANAGLGLGWARLRSGGVLRFDSERRSPEDPPIPELACRRGRSGEREGTVVQRSSINEIKHDARPARTESAAAVLLFSLCFDLL